MEKPLTAEGYGELSFTGFYPNCKNILTFFDPAATAGDEYEIWGWHSLGDKTKPFLNNILIITANMMRKERKKIC